MNIRLHVTPLLPWIFAASSVWWRRNKSWLITFIFLMSRKQLSYGRSNSHLLSLMHPAVTTSLWTCVVLVVLLDRRSQRGCTPIHRETVAMQQLTDLAQVELPNNPTEQEHTDTSCCKVFTQYEYKYRGTVTQFNMRTGPSPNMWPSIPSMTPQNKHLMVFMCCGCVPHPKAELILYVP